MFSGIPKIDADKLNRLKTRLVTKKVTNGINAIPTFFGIQEFYKEFIIAASSYGFNEHLKNTFITEIVELNESNFESNNFEDSETVDLNTKQKFIQCVNSLRILAKFLGFIESLPYQTDIAINAKVLTAEINVRKYFRPHIDIQTIVKSSISNGCLVLCIPWLVKYLSMLDYITIRLPYYVEVLEMLFSIYCKKRSVKYTLTNFGSILIDLSLGWLFELPHFPSEFYYSYFEKNSDFSSDFCNNVDTTLEKDIPIDHLDIVDFSILHMLCPYLEEIKQMLQSNNFSGNAVKIKHITPLTAVESTSEITEKRLKVCMYIL